MKTLVLFAGAASFAGSVALTVKIVASRANSSDQRERVILPVRQHRFGWRSYRPVLLGTGR